MQDHETTDGKAELYRLEVEGSVTASWVAWFEAETIARAGANTVLEMRVADQGELHGRLRRIHDLNLRLISVTSIVREKPGALPGASTIHDNPEDPSNGS